MKARICTSSKATVLLKCQDNRDSAWRTKNVFVWQLADTSLHLSIPVKLPSRYPSLQAGNIFRPVAANLMNTLWLSFMTRTDGSLVVIRTFIRSWWPDSATFWIFRVFCFLSIFWTYLCKWWNFQVWKWTNIEKII